MQVKVPASDRTSKERDFIPSVAQVGKALHWFGAFFCLLFYSDFWRNESKLVGRKHLILMLRKTLSVFPSKKV